jgi:hypothetical protein
MADFDVKEKIKRTVLSGASSTKSVFSNPGYYLSYYFGASSFYGDRVEKYYPKRDGWKKERNYFIPIYFKALGRQMQK